MPAHADGRSDLLLPISTAQRQSVVADAQLAAMNQQHKATAQPAQGRQRGSPGRRLAGSAPLGGLEGDLEGGKTTEPAEDLGLSAGAASRVWTMLGQLVQEVREITALVNCMSASDEPVPRHKVLRWPGKAPAAAYSVRARYWSPMFSAET